jgi:homocysteine S-methyltransferase
MEIREFFKQGKPLLFDGAMGTYFADQPGREEELCEGANLDRPQQVAAIHRAYLEAGCQAVKTNTFAVSALLARGEETLADQITQAGYQLAQEAARPYGAYVFADLGPAPQGEGIDAGALYSRQADLFLRQGATCFLLETLSTDDGVEALARHLKERCPEAFLLVSFAVGFDGLTQAGCAGADLLRRTAARKTVDAVGFNCVSGPHHLLEYIKTLPLDGITLSVMPNAGYPTVLGRRTVFQGTPEYFGEKLAQIAQAGAAIVGGCCGTTPAHIAQARAALEKARPVSVSVQPKEQPPRPAPEGNSLWEKLEQGKRVLAVELDPPVDDAVGPFLEGVQALKAAGADAVTIADCPVGRPRADSCLLACKVKRELGVEPLPHMTCRDRNLNATKALLLGLSMEGVHNVLLVTGDPIPTGDREVVKSVFNFNSRKLAQFVGSLNQQTLTTPFRAYGALNVNAANFDAELRRAQEKEACGVVGFLTQPVLSREGLDNLKKARAALAGKLLGGIFPVVSHKNACFLNNEVSGIRVCDEIVAMYQGKDREEGETLAVTISTQVARELTPYTDGLYLITPFRRVELMGRILKEIEGI